MKKHRLLANAFVIGAAAFSAAGCGSSNEAECGSGTTESEGQCVPDGTMQSQR